MCLGKVGEAACRDMHSLNITDPVQVLGALVQHITMNGAGMA